MPLRRDLTAAMSALRLQRQERGDRRTGRRPERLRARPVSARFMFATTAASPPPGGLTAVCRSSARRRPNTMAAGSSGSISPPASSSGSSPTAARTRFAGPTTSSSTAPAASGSPISARCIASPARLRRPLLRRRPDRREVKLGRGRMLSYNGVGLSPDERTSTSPTPPARVFGPTISSRRARSSARPSVAIRPAWSAP